MSKHTTGFKAMVKARDEALLSMDKERIKGYAKKYGVPLPEDEQTFWIGVHKARTAATGLPMAARSESKRWLLERGYHALDDGDVPV